MTDQFDDARHPRRTDGRFRPADHVASRDDTIESLRTQADAQATPMTRALLPRTDPAGFEALRSRVAEESLIPPEAIEKDYWGTEILRSVIQPADGVAAVVFKGGTSLSKAFGLIERVSEDVDVIVVLDGDPSGNRVKRTLRLLASRAAEDVGVPIGREAEGRGYLNGRYIYQAHETAEALTPGVLLEMGSRGGPVPNEVRQVRSYLSESAEQLDPALLDEHPDLQPFEVTVLAPERTLGEKLAFLHHRSTIGDDAALRAGARHLYDVAMILRQAEIRDRLEGGVIATLMVDVDARSEAAGWGYTPRPADGFGASPAFSTSSACADAMRIGYEEVRSLVWGEMPSFRDALAIVTEHARLL